MNAQQAADFLSESPQHEISRHKAHIKILEEALTMKRESYKELQSQNADLLETLEAVSMLIENSSRPSPNYRLSMCVAAETVLPYIQEAIRKAKGE